MSLRTNSRRTNEEKMSVGVDVRGPDECWPWRGYTDGKGYGRVHLHGYRSPMAAHRAVAVLAGWDITGLFVLHRCDNPPCCNPSHLFVGDHQANMDDRSHKGRTARQHGPANGQAKLTTEQVTDIRRRVEEGEQQKALAVEYGVTRSNVSHIMHERARVYA